MIGHLIFFSNSAPACATEPNLRPADKSREKTVRTTLMGTFVLGVLATASPAMAQDSESFTVQSQVPPFCSQFSVGPAPMDLGALTGASGQIVSAFATGSETERELSASFYCNAPSVITIKAEPLMHDTVTVVSDAASFTNRVDYTATLKWRDLQGSVSSTATAPQEIDATEANIGSLTLKLSNPAVTNNLRPIAGSYAGQVRLTIALAQ